MAPGDGRAVAEGEPEDRLRQMEAKLAEAERYDRDSSDTRRDPSRSRLENAEGWLGALGLAQCHAQVKAAFEDVNEHIDKVLASSCLDIQVTAWKADMEEVHAAQRAACGSYYSQHPSDGVSLAKTMMEGDNTIVTLEEAASRPHATQRPDLTIRSPILGTSPPL